MNFLYRVEHDTAFASEGTAGPWDPRLQHGGAPTALICWAAERMVTREPMQVVRITVDLLRPVPVAPLQIRTEVVREGRKIQLCAVTLLHENVVVVRATVLKIRNAELDLPPTAVEEKVVLPGPDQGYTADAPPGAHPNSFIRGLTLRVVHGAFREPGPAAIWFRVNRPLFENETPTPLQRVAMVADFCNGVSTVLEWARWTFINGDLTISLARMPVGDWILLDATTWLGDHGAGIAFAKLGDSRGYFGRAVQSLVIEPRAGSTSQASA
jgi:Thioesterase-like superfamily